MKDLPIHFEQPIWLVIPIILVSLALSAFLYYRKQRIFPDWLSILLFSLRFLVFFFLGVLLLNPFFFHQEKLSQKPVLVVAIDESESMMNHMDSLSLSVNIQNIQEEIQNELSEFYEIDFLSFDHAVKESPTHQFKGKRSDLGQLLNYVEDKYYMLPVGGVIMLTDGIYNQGISPLHEAEKSTTSIYPIAIGDTNQYSDAAIKNIFHNKVVRQNASFSVEVVVQANALQNEKIQLQLLKNGKVLQEKEILIDTENQSVVANFELNAFGNGLESYEVKILNLSKERNLKNNRSVFYVQVIESGNRILILGDHHHPDLGAIASALRKVEGFEVDVKTLQDFPIKPDGYELVIFHGLPSLDERSKELFENDEWKRKAIWYIWSSSTSFEELDQQDFSLDINSPISGYEYTEIAPNVDFNNFNLPLNWAHIYNDYPPLYMPFTQLSSNRKIDVLFNQSIRGYESGEPLLCFWNAANLKRSYLAGEGLWKWRLYSHQNKGNHEDFNLLMQRISKYLLTGTYSDRFNIQYQSSYSETDLIKWNALVYNEAYETNTDAEVSVFIYDESGSEYPYQFSIEENGYSAHLGYLKAGKYSFKAEAKLIDTAFSEEGNFVIEAWNMEQAKNVTDITLLRQMASISGGQVFFSNQGKELVEVLKNKPESARRYSFVEKIVNLIDFPYIGLLILLLLSSEWVLRKRYGSY